MSLRSDSPISGLATVRKKKVLREPSKAQRIAACSVCSENQDNNGAGCEKCLKKEELEEELRKQKAIDDEDDDEPPQQTLLPARQKAQLTDASASASVVDAVFRHLSLSAAPPAPTGVRPDLVPGLMRYAKNGPSFLLEALYDSDAAHDYDCNFATTSDWNPNINPKTGNPGNSGLKDCSTDGYFMVKEYYETEAARQLELSLRVADAFESGSKTLKPLNVRAAISSDHTLTDIPFANAVKFPTRRPIEVPPELKPGEKPPVVDVEDVWVEDAVYGQQSNLLKMTFYLTSIYRRLDPWAQVALASSVQSTNPMAAVPSKPETNPAIYNFLRVALASIPKSIPVSWKEAYTYKKAKWAPTTYQRTLKDYIDNLCMAPERATRVHMNEEAAARVKAMNDGPVPWDGKPIVRKTNKGEEYKEDPEHPNFHHKDVDSIITAGSEKLKGEYGFVVELIMWTHWASLDTSGPTPRGSVFLRYVDWKDSYLKYPRLPIFKPESCNPILWEEYMSHFRYYKLRLASRVQSPNQPPPPFGEFELTSFFEDMKRIDGDRYDTCFPRADRADGQAGDDDYLYVILICASGREHETKPKERKPSGGGRTLKCEDDKVAVAHPSGTFKCEERYKKVDTGFGRAQLDMVDEFAKRLGVKRTVLSALAHVVPYYHRTMKFSCCSRHGRDLTYLTKKFMAPTSMSPGGNPGFLDVYNLYPFSEADLEDPTLKNPKNVEEAKDKYGITNVRNPPTPYYIAEAQF